MSVSAEWVKLEHEFHMSKAVAFDYILTTTVRDHMRFYEITRAPFSLKFRGSSPAYQGSEAPELGFKSHDGDPQLQLVPHVPSGLPISRQISRSRASGIGRYWPECVNQTTRSEPPLAALSLQICVSSRRPIVARSRCFRAGLSTLLCLSTCFGCGVEGWRPLGWCSSWA